MAPLHPMAGSRWSIGEESKLMKDLENGIPLEVIAAQCGRTIGAIKAREKKVRRELLVHPPTASVIDKDKELLKDIQEKLQIIIDLLSTKMQI